MSTQEERPQVSFVLISYNQEDTIQEAVKAAFLQDYSPLEVVISDDCSRDRTFDIVGRMAVDYVGPHRVVLNRNERNLGIAGNVNRAVARASGDLIVMAAGDDVSLPKRVNRALKLWDTSSRRADGMMFGAYENSVGGAVWAPRSQSFLTAETIVEDCTLNIRGAASAWTRRLFGQWGPLPEDAGAEDRVLAFRAALSGGLVSDPQPVVVYRTYHGKKSTLQTARFGRRLWALKRDLDFYATYGRDLQRLLDDGVGDEERLRRLRRRLEQRVGALRREIGLLEQGTRWAGLKYGMAVALGFVWTRRAPRARALECASALKRLALLGQRVERLDAKDHHGTAPSK